MGPHAAPVYTASRRRQNEPAPDGSQHDAEALERAAHSRVAQRLQLHAAFARIGREVVGAVSGMTAQLGDAGGQRVQDSD